MAVLQVVLSVLGFFLGGWALLQAALVVLPQVRTPDTTSTLSESADTERITLSVKALTSPSLESERSKLGAHSRPVLILLCFLPS